MLGAQLPLVSALPFVALLLAIALAPLAAPTWWHHNRNKALIAFLISLPVLLYLGRTEIGRQLLLEKAHEYTGFIVVIGALFMITGGIHIEGSLAGTPLVNTAMLAIGAVLCNLLGTTGASVLLIRPLLRANKRRKRVAHIVIFFIFIVGNCGGLLTPIGDPPLLLGFLKGVPFTWTLRLWPQWLALNGVLLVLFNIWDRWANRDEVKVPSHEPLRVRGAIELAALAGVMATIVTSGSLLAILIFALIAYFLGSQEHRTLNVFTFVPLVEVAVLFAAIFITMTPVLEILNARAADFGLTSPRQFFWASGTLSSVLDNAPTYLAFAASAAGLQGIPPHGPYIGALALDPHAAKLLAAISTGSVFMGANTYIGNAPNFIVRAIALEHGVAMPSFFGYMAYSLAVLLPLFVVVSFVFFG